MAVRFVQEMSLQALQDMHSGSLLQRLKNLRILDQNFESSDLMVNEHHDAQTAGYIVFKDSIRWQNAVSDVKQVLASRPHLPRGNKEQRRAAQREKQNR